MDQPLPTKDKRTMKQWKHTNAHPPKKAKSVVSVGKAMTSVFLAIPRQ